MKKIILAILLNISVFADIDISFPEDIIDSISKRILSIELGTGSITRMKADTISRSSDISRDLIFGGLKLGAEDIGLRLFLSYRPLEIESEIIHSFGIELDSIIELNNRLNFFYGLVGGIVLYTIEDNNKTLNYTTDASAYYGVETGLTFKISETHEVEFGGRIAITNLNNKVADKNYIFDQFTNIYLAYNYKY